MPELKQCSQCGQSKPFADFDRRRQKPSGLMVPRSQCRKCLRANKGSNSPERLQQMRAAAFKRKYGLSWSQYLKMFEDRDGLCDICHKPETRMIREKLMPLCVDHDHDTGAVRGLLCSNCNVAIGLLHHDAKLLTSALAYLEG